MKPEEVFFDAVTNIRGDLIEDAQQFVFRRRVSWQKYAGIAACLALVLCLCMLPMLGGMGGSGSGEETGTASGDSSGWNGSIGEPAADTPSGVNSFIADVLEVDGDVLLVVPQPGSGIWSVSDRVAVPMGQAAHIPDVRPGDRIQVTYAGSAGPDYVEDVREIIILYSMETN